MGKVVAKVQNIPRKHNKFREIIELLLPVSQRLKYSVCPHTPCAETVNKANIEKRAKIRRRF